MTLCSSCSSITLQSLSEGQGHLLHNHWFSLEKAAETCALCQILVEYLRPEIELTPLAETFRDPIHQQQHFRVPIVAKYSHGLHLPEEEHALQEKPSQRSYLSITCGPRSIDTEEADEPPIYHLHHTPLSDSLQGFSATVSVPIYVCPGIGLLESHKARD